MSPQTVPGVRRLRKCIATVALSGTLPDKLEAAVAISFDGVEIMESDLLTFDGSPQDVRRICENLGLAIDLYQPFRDIEAMPERPAVCAVAIRVDDAARTLDRAGALLCPDWQERVGAGERHIPAVRAPDDTLRGRAAKRRLRGVWRRDRAGARRRTGAAAFGHNRTALRGGT